MAEFNATYGLNCTALYYTVLAFLELLDEGNKRKMYLNGKSQVIATAANAAFLRIAKTGFGLTSSKAAVVSLVKSLSTFCVPWGIRFNALAPGCKFVLIFNSTKFFLS
jgi:NAD(P)-dependent dehydrogenase (short-subunit alcohol dehydrogenase family)